MELLGEERRGVVATCRRMVADGLVVGTSGNVSVRAGDLVAVSPSGLPYEDLTPELVGVHTLDGGPVQAPLAPTSELPMHLAVYAHTGARAVVHTHSVAATAVSILVETVPSVHYQVATFGGPIRVARYATYGTPELAANMAVALSGRTGCLLANHGTVAIGRDLGEAYTRARYLEWLCDVWLRASAVGTPKLLPDEEIARVVEKLRSYGVSRPGATPGPG
jgi:L-fuculose-phosphate aldolase